MTQLSFSLLTSTNDLTKRFDLVDGRIVKASAAHMTRGTIDKVVVGGLEGLAETIRGLNASQALSYGILANGRETAQVVTQSKLEEARHKASDSNSIVARTHEHLNFAHQPGVMMADHDEYKGEVLSLEDLIERLRIACPALGQAKKLWKPSSSYGICASNDPSIAITGGGQRLYFAVKRAADIPGAGQDLSLRLWAAGFGWIKVSKSGRPLKRSLLDDSVYQPERLDFAGPPILGPGVIRKAPEPRIIEGCEFLDLAALACDNDIQARAHQAMAAALKAVQPELQAVKKQWIETLAPDLAQRCGISIDLARQCLSQASDHCQLSGDFLLLTENDETVSVREVLDNPMKWHGTRFADPLEPSYGNNDHRIAWANLRSGCRPYIYSHAHGGIRYTLTKPAARIRLAKGDRGRITSETEGALSLLGEIYDYGDGGSARIAQSRIRTVSLDWFADYIDRNVTYYSIVANAEGGHAERPCDAPPYLPRRILARHGERGFPRLEGLVTAPTLRRDGSVLDTPGYDRQSEILYVSDVPNPPQVPLAPTVDDAFRALAVLWCPFKDFPFVGVASQTVMVSAILSGILRPSLPTCPGHAFDAPAAGTGKTLLAECIGILATGERPAIIAPTDDDTEIRKRLFSILREGGGVILWDNISAPLGGDALDAFLTAERFRERVLGVSESETLPNRALLLITGNNISTRGDTFRRVLKARLDAKLETPYLRAFALNPREYCMAHRHEMVVAALTIVRAWFAAGCPREAEGNTASFEDWDRLVRQPLAWLGTEDLVGGRSDIPNLCDVAVVFAEAAAEAPHKEKLRAVLHAWDGAFKKGERVCARDVSSNPYDGFHDEQNVSKKAEAERAELKRDELVAAIAEAVGRRGRDIDTTVLGYWLKKHIGERMDGLWYERDGEVRGAAAYVLRREL